MLVDKDLFDIVESEVRKSGAIEKLETECGSVWGRMMITAADVPEELAGQMKSKKCIAFNASFDVCDSMFGVALDADTHEAVSGIWVTPQVEGAENPPQEWVPFFIEKLMECFEEDGSCGLPSYTFMTEEGTMTVNPTIMD